MTSRNDALPFAVPVPGEQPAEVAIAAPGGGPGHWAGSPSAALGPDGEMWLAYQLRRPVGDGRGYGVMIAKADDGVHFTPQALLDRADFVCDLRAACWCAGPTAGGASS